MTFIASAHAMVGGTVIGAGSFRSIKVRFFHHSSAVAEEVSSTSSFAAGDLAKGLREARRAAR